MPSESYPLPLPRKTLSARKFLSVHCFLLDVSVYTVKGALNHKDGPYFKDIFNIFKLERPIIKFT